jgi:glycosyltransferase involved in cell wall biosynthesis
MSNFEEVKISVLIPTWNRKDFLSICLNSIFRQTHKNLEIIVYDDGSTDNTKLLLDQLCKGDSRVRYYYHPKNLGVAHARNALLNLCKTKYAAWQDSDDLSNIHRIAEQGRLIKGDRYPVVNCYWTTFDKNKPDLWEGPPGGAFGGRPGFATIMFNVDKALEFDEKYFAEEDVEWRERMRLKYGEEKHLQIILYYISWKARNRLGRLKNEKGVLIKK